MVFSITLLTQWAQQQSLEPANLVWQKRKPYRTDYAWTDTEVVYVAQYFLQYLDEYPPYRVSPQPTAWVLLITYTWPLARPNELPTTSPVRAAYCANHLCLERPHRLRPSSVDAFIHDLFGIVDAAVQVTCSAWEPSTSSKYHLRPAPNLRHCTLSWTFPTTDYTSPLEWYFLHKHIHRNLTNHPTIRIRHGQSIFPHTEPL